MLGVVAHEAAEHFGDRTAFVSADGWELSYADLDRLADEAAVGLLNRGVAEGDVVALVLPPLPEYLVLYVALARIGAAVAGVNHRLGAAERSAVLGVARARLVLATAELAPDGEDTAYVRAASCVEDLLRDLRVPEEAPPALAPDPDRPVAVVFTSGTTGLPKGAVFTDRQLAFITGVDTGHRWGGGGAQFAGTSLAHLGPMTKFEGNLHKGGTIHLMHRWRATDALAMIQEHRMAGIGGIPTQIALMLRQPDFDEYDLSSIQAIVIGGGPATPALVREARARFQAALAVRYSCTEAGIGFGTAFDAPPEDAEVSVGRPHEGVDLLLLGDDGPVAPDAVGEVGEVCLRSPAVMSHYHDAPEATAAAFTDDGFVRTGDLGHLDDQGRLRLVGRAKEMYVRGGYNVYPMEVESVLATHPAVAEVAVAAVPDEVMGEVGVAVIVPVVGAVAPSLDELRAFAADDLAKHKLPERLVVAPELPLTAMEKLDRAELARRVR